MKNEVESIDPQYIPLLLSEIKKIVAANNEKKSPERHSAYVIMGDILQRAACEFENIQAYSDKLINSLDQFIFSLIHYNEAVLLRQLAVHRDFFIAHLKKIKPYQYPSYSLSGYIDVSFHSFAEDAVAMIEFLQEYGWQYTESHLEVAINNHAREAVRFFLKKYSLTLEDLEPFAKLAVDVGNVTILNMLLPAQPFFYFADIIKKLQSDAEISFRSVLNVVSKAYRYSNMLDVDKLCINFITHIKEKYAENSKILTIKQAFYHARKLFPWASQVALYRRKSDLIDLNEMYRGGSQVAQEMHSGFKKLYYVNSLLAQKEKKEIYSLDYFINNIAVHHTEEAKSRGLVGYSCVLLLSKLPEKLEKDVLYLKIDEEKKTITVQSVDMKSPKHLNRTQYLELNKTLEKRRITFEKLPRKIVESKLIMLITLICNCLRENDLATNCLMIRTDGQAVEPSTACSQRYDRHHHLLEKEFQYASLPNRLTNDNGYRITFNNIELSRVEIVLQPGDKYLYLYKWMHGRCEIAKITPEAQSILKILLNMDTANVQKDPRTFYDELVKLVWLIGNATLVWRGSGYIVEILLAFFHEYHDFDPPVLDGFQLDCLDLSFSTHERYRELFPYFFKSPSLPFLMQQLIKQQYDSSLELRNLLLEYRLNPPDEPTTEPDFFHDPDLATAKIPYFWEEILEREIGEIKRYKKTDQSCQQAFFEHNAELDKPVTDFVTLANRLRRYPQHPLDSKALALMHDETIGAQLRAACILGNTEKIVCLTRKNLELLTTVFIDYNNQTALHFAVLGPPQTLDTLIQLLEEKQKGLLIKMLLIKDKNGKLPIDIALENKQEDPVLLKLLTTLGPHIVEAAHANIKFANRLYDLVKNEAKQGQAWAQTDLACFYLNEVGVKRKPSYALKWFLNAASQGHIKAQFYVGICFIFGTGVSKNDKQAAVWFLHAAKQGDDEAQLNMGFHYEQGKGVVQNQQQAVFWYKKAAKQGYATAQNRLAFCYLNGVGVARDEKEAVKWFSLAAEQGHGEAQFELGIRYQLGQGVPQNYDEAAKRYLQAADNKYAAAQCNVGVYILDGRIKSSQPEIDAVSWFQKAAEQGNAVAQYNLGILYAAGNGVTADVRKAAEWY